MTLDPDAGEKFYAETDPTYRASQIDRGAIMKKRNDGSDLIVPGDYLATLQNCEGYYLCPTDADGMPLGPVVGYTAPYDGPGGKKMKWVGLAYLNFSKADRYPAVLTFFAEALAEKIRSRNLIPDVILGAPWAAVKFSQEVARILGSRHINAEKKPFINDDGKPDEEIVSGRYEGEIRPGDIVAIGEELINNASTTEKLVKIANDAGGHVNSIFCAINRSSPFKETFWNAPRHDPVPIIGVIERPYPQFHQDDPIVAKAIAEGNIAWKPKYEWDRLKEAMERHATD